VTRDRVFCSLARLSIFLKHLPYVCSSRSNKSVVVTIFLMLLLYIVITTNAQIFNCYFTGNCLGNPTQVLQVYRCCNDRGHAITSFFFPWLQLASPRILRNKQNANTMVRVSLFCVKHSTNADLHTRTSTHPYEHTHAHSTLMSTSKRLSRLDFEIHEVGHQERLTVNGYVTSY
jgi:hypothetical protein